MTCSLIDKCERGQEMLGESQLALATQAGRMVVDAATTDGWETAERRYTEVLGRGDAERTRLAGQWLEETRGQLTGKTGADTELLRTALAVRWAGRLADLLKENPDAETDLKALVQDIQAAAPNGEVSVPHRVVSANGVVSTHSAGLEHPGVLATRSELAYSAGL